MAATVASNQLESLPQPSSQPTSPALYSSFNQPSRTPSSNMYSARSQGSLPGTPTTSTYNGSIFDIPPGANYADFLRTWSDSHVSTWLTNIKCGHHSATFRASDIRGDVLLELDQVTLKEIGVVSVRDRLLHDDTSMGGHLPFNSGPPRTLNLIFLISSVTLPIIPTPFAQILFALFHTPPPSPLHPQHQFRTLEILSRAALELLTFLSHPSLVVIPHPHPPPPPPPPLVPPQKLIFFCPTQP